MDEKTTFLFQIHYYLEGTNNHCIDAFLHNKYESYLLRAISEISKMSGCDGIKVILNLSEEGGWKDNIKILSGNGAFLILLGAFINSHFSPAVDETTDAKNLIEAAVALKEGDFTEEEASILVAGNEKLTKFKSEYYKNVEKDHTIQKIETTLTDCTTSNVIVNKQIVRQEFYTHIIPGEEKNKHEILSTTIYIVSPVLVDIKRMKWHGIFSEEKITFTITDNEFIDQVRNRLVKFDAGTSITCDLTIKENIKYEGNKRKTSLKYIVTKVHAWADGSHYHADGRMLLQE